MPLTCELGWHSPDPLARWNHGYYFSKCTRCGRDLVRTAYSGWKVPKGVRVVWQAEPPAGWQSADLVPATSTAEAAPDAEAAPAAALQEPEPLAAPAPPPEEPEAETIAAPSAPPERVEPEAAGDEEAPRKPDEPEQAEVAELAPEEPQRESGGASEETETAAEPEPSREDEPELPIMAVLRDLSATPPQPDTDVAEVATEQTQSQPVAEAAAPDEEEPELAFAETAPPPPRRSVVDDFMNEEPPASWQPLARPAPEPQPVPAFEQPEPCFRSIAAEESGSSADAVSAPEAVAAGEFDPLPEFRGPAPADEAEEAKGADETPQPRRLAGSGWWLAGAGAAAAAVLVLLPSFQGRDDRSPAPEEARAHPQLIESPPAEAPPPAAAPSPTHAPRVETAYVAAPILHCRTAPAEQAQSARKLSRGVELKVLGREPEWVSVSHEGRQCWVAGRYLSPDRPL